MGERNDSSFLGKQNLSKVYNTLDNIQIYGMDIFYIFESKLCYYLFKINFRWYLQAKKRTLAEFPSLGGGAPQDVSYR